MSYQLIKPDSENQTGEHGITIFLAGSIEMGSASDWQVQVQEAIKESSVTVFNPRRNDWNPAWEQTKKNPHFVKQVNWELDRLQESDIIFMFLEPGTKSPISLYELGRFYQKTILVCCPDGFWRKGNVDIAVERDELWEAPTLDVAIERLIATINQYTELLYQQHIS